MLFGTSAEAGERLRDALAARPSTESAWVALRRALDTVLEAYDGNDERTRRLTRLVLQTRHSPLGIARRTLAGTTCSGRPAVARRLGVDPADDADPRVGAVIAAALGCVEAALTAWISETQRKPLPVILDQAMGTLARQSGEQG